MSILPKSADQVNGSGIGIEAVLSRLQNVKRSGRGWTARCPAHDDRRNSLSVALGQDGRILIKCFAGCETEAILRALGLGWADLFPHDGGKRKAHSQPARRIVATYDYTDAAGRLLFQVVRFETKSFAQRRPDPAAPGGWVWNLNGVEPVLYRLPQVLEAVQAGKTVFVCEGEKDADNLAALGLCATTCPMGAEKWRDSYSEALAGADVVILCDNDEPGRRHAKQAAESLRRHGCRVRVLELPGLPDKGDVSDWLAAGGTREELLRLAEAAPLWEPKRSDGENGSAPDKAGADGGALAPEEHTVERALLLLAGRCDGARARDGAGFNKHDAEIGRRLASKIADGTGLTAQERRRAHRMLRKYRAQLARMGIDYDRIPVPEPAPAAAAGGKPAILVTNRGLDEIRADALEALLAKNDPPVLFQRGGALVRVRRDDDGLMAVEQLSEAALRGRLAEVATWWREDKRGDCTATAPPREIAEDILALAEWPFPILRGIATSPVLSPTGELVATRGYDPKTGLWHDYCGVDFRLPPPNPTPQQVRDAIDLIFGELLCDFPFVDRASQAHTLAAMLAPIVLPYLRWRPIPLHLFDAPSEGTGKGLLAQVVSIPCASWPVPAMAAAEDEDEWRKRITSILRDCSGPYALIDNARGRLDSAALSSVLTAPLWSDRLLGQSKTIRVPARVIWLCTGNNVALSNELARRTIWIRLDAKMERPWLRSGFRHALPEWALERRGDLLSACLVIVQAWVAEGRPEGAETLGSFEAWARTVGGILDVAGVPGLLENALQLYDRADERVREWRAFVAAWRDRFGLAEVRADQLFELAAELDLLPSVLGNAPTERAQKIRLGKALSRYLLDRTLAGVRVQAREDHRGQNVYYLVPAPQEPDNAKTKQGEEEEEEEEELNF